MTLWPTRTFRWAAPVLFVAVAGFMLWSAFQDLIHGTPPDAVPWWFPLVLAAPLIGMAVLSNRALYIRVDDSTIVFGPNLLGRRRFDRRELARIRGSFSPFGGRATFLRSDGSTLWSTPGTVWGRAGLRSLAGYLDVPLDGAESIASYWDFGRWS